MPILYNNRARVYLLLAKIFGAVFLLLALTADTQAASAPRASERLTWIRNKVPHRAVETAIKIVNDALTKTEKT